MAISGLTGRPVSALAARDRHHARARRARAEIEARHRAHLRRRIVKLKSYPKRPGGWLLGAAPGRRRRGVGGADDLDTARALDTAGLRGGDRQTASNERFADCGNRLGAESAGHPQRHRKLELDSFQRAARVERGQAS
jgi:hypothetical protein